MRVFCKNAKIFVIVTHNAEMKLKKYIWMLNKCQIIEKYSVYPASYRKAMFIDKKVLR